MTPSQSRTLLLIRNTALTATVGVVFVLSAVADMFFYAARLLP
jgi:hypothetical protein